LIVDSILRKIFGSKHERDIKAIQPTVHRINALESSLSSLSDQQLVVKTDEFKKRLVAGETLEDLL